MSKAVTAYQQMSPPKEQVMGLLLAGGKSRRMGGQNKALMKLSDKAMIQHVSEHALPQVGCLVINANQNRTSLMTLCPDLAFICDQLEGHLGPLAGIAAGMHEARARGFDWLASFSCDAPFMPRDFVERCWHVKGLKGEIVLAQTFGRAHPVAGLWSCSLLESLTLFLQEGGRRVDKWTSQHKELRADFTPPDLDQTYSGGPQDPFFNINRPQDLDVAEDFLRR